MVSARSLHFDAVALVAVAVAAVIPFLGLAVDKAFMWQGGTQPVWTALAIVWALGAVVVLARAVVAQVRAVRVARRAPLHDTIDGVRVVIGPATAGPHVVGIVRPRIVVPPALVAEPAMLHAALLHELAHVRRRDALARLVEIWASAVMWWNPVVRLVARKLDLAREAACDAYALEHGIARPAYARLLAPLPGRAREADPPLVRPAAEPLRTAVSGATMAPPPRLPRQMTATVEVGGQPGGLDKASWQRLRTGRLVTERTLDLHGMTVHQAHHALISFLRGAHVQRLRVVEVITGRGSGENSGAIRREFPHWLNGPDIRPLILGAAHPHAQNPGSVRLLLRRIR